MTNRFTNLVLDILNRMPVAAVSLIILMVLGGLMEGLGVMMIYPLLSILGVSRQVDSDGLLKFFETGFSMLELDMSSGSLLAVICIILLIQSIISLTQGWLSARSITNFVNGWRNEVLKAFLGAKWKFFVSRRHGDLFYTLFTDTERSGGGFSMVIQLASTIIITTIYIGYSMLISWQVTIILLLIAFVILLIGYPVIKRGGLIGSELSKCGSDTQAMVNEYISGAKLIKATSTENIATTNFSLGLSRWNLAYFKILYHPVILRVVFETLAMIMLISMLVFGVESLGIDMASILVILALFLRLYPKLSGIQQNIHTLNITLPAYARVTELSGIAAENTESLNQDSLPDNFKNKPVSIRIENLTAGYGDSEIVKDVNLEIPAGKSIAIVGESGAGKSTIVDCVINLVDIFNGNIYLNDRPITEVPLSAWRKSVGYVGQETFLFHASIRENITWGTDKADNVVSAANVAGAHEFITAMSNGYETLVGDRGVKLSGGQRQRIGLARALCGHKQLLILDEATSALDSVTEKQVMNTIYSIHGEITIVIVAHRLSTVRNADYIYVVDKGCVVEKGTWEELIALNGKFNRLWKIQSSGGKSSSEIGITKNNKERIK